MKSKKNKLIVVLLFLTFFAGDIMATSSLPNLSKSEIEEVENKNIGFEQPVEQADSINLENPDQIYSHSSSSFENVETVQLTDEMIDALDKYETLISRKQYDRALEEINFLPVNVLTDSQLDQKKMLELFYAIELDQIENERQFGKDESLDPTIQRTVVRLQKEAKFFLLDSKNDLAKDVLIQSLYLDRKNFISKEILDRALGLPIGTYKVENVEKKYWEDSLVLVRSGFPLQSVDALNVLANFDPENPMIFERMGSSYYLGGKVNKAIESWKRALFLDPNNTALKIFIEKAQAEQKRQDALVQKYFDNKKKDQANDALDSSVEMLTLRVVSDSTTAYSYAQEVRQSQPGVKVIVEEQSNGKWAVKIPKIKETK